ncbi:precorrin-6A reductase [Anaeroglobus sp. AF13-6AC]|uniref:precorrin-6A reductase n=1 Tax=Anaeroglobus sp. AF13-6AC TaxID=2997918 RepID=UPI0022E3F696|nr:precorrin-6A reductase [Anaeroglobus sp. AF13-6AC]
MSLRIWIAAGTTEGRLLAEELAYENVELAVTVATEYGASLIIDKPNVSVIDKRLDDRGMAEFIDEFKPDLAIDATHPYAAMVTETMRRVCEKKGVVYKRLLRPLTDEEDCLRFSSVEEAAAWLDEKEGVIFLTTGSKDLHKFATIRNYKQRLAVRILPVRESLDKALNNGYVPSRIIAMQGPFSVDLNTAMFKEFQSAWVVTKNSGSIGGFSQKLEAARAAKAKLIVIERPEDAGSSYEEIRSFVKSQTEA